MEERISFGVILLVPSAHEPQRRNTMSTFKLLGAVAILSTALATPVLGQQVISEPGYCAFFYPNANCQNKGQAILTPIPITGAEPLKMAACGQAVKPSE